MAKSKYTGSVEVDVQEAIDALNDYEKKQIFQDNLDSVLEIGEALECYTESELIDYIKNHFTPDYIFD